MKRAWVAAVGVTSSDGELGKWRNGHDAGSLAAMAIRFAAEADLMRSPCAGLRTPENSRPVATIDGDVASAGWTCTP